ncbi:MAG: tRNA(Ile)-lysidine synthetase, partial [Rubrivivax sp.]|nr:tRNA(Ile)-lysidine synthetase [Rubrivivax sp.]
MNRTVAVAASGGRDSTALLHATARQASALGLQVIALHVHHGLMQQADAWAAQVRSQARRWRAGFA